MISIAKHGRPRVKYYTVMACDGADADCTNSRVLHSASAVLAMPHAVPDLRNRHV